SPGPAAATLPGPPGSKERLASGTLARFSTSNVTVSGTTPCSGVAVIVSGAGPVLDTVAFTDTDLPPWVVTVAVSVLVPGCSGTSLAKKLPPASRNATTPFTVTPELAGASTVPAASTLAPVTVAPSAGLVSAMLGAA